MKKSFFIFVRESLYSRCIVIFLTWTFIFGQCFSGALAQQIPATANSLMLAAPGSMIAPSTDFHPSVVKGLTLYPDDPFRFDFIIYQGDKSLDSNDFKEESARLIKYFLAALTIPEKDIWVNLSPSEKDRIIPDQFAKTDMGRDLLAQDYLLKQLTASLMYPEEELGRKFWERVYAKAEATYGTIDIPIDTFNKVWVLPEKAVIYAHENSVFVVDSKLKVMLGAPR